MTICVILVGRLSDIDNGATPHKVMTTRDYLAHPSLFNGQLRPRIINLSRSYAYQSRGYYASLLAEARGHRIIPSVETMIDLSERRLYENAIPELEDMLNKALGKHPEKAPETIHVHFGLADSPDFEKFGRLLFDWFRAPSLEVSVVSQVNGPESRRSALPTSPSFPRTRRSVSRRHSTDIPSASGVRRAQRCQRAIPSQRCATRRKRCRRQPFQR